MCGIFALFNRFMYIQNSDIVNSFNNIKHRGPDASIMKTIKNVTFGFHRLAINDISDNGMQPFEKDDVYLICNGEIYNHKQLVIEHNLQCSSNSDCEVILHLYLKYGIYVVPKLLHGVFSFVIYDNKRETMYAVVDRISIRPLFYQIDQYRNICIASEAKGMQHININPKHIQQLRAGHIMEINQFNYGFSNYYSIPNCINNFINLDEFKQKLIDSVELRLMSDRKIGCLLSGGLDSSLIASILAKHFGKKINTFTIGFEDSTDLEYAREVANYIGSDHHEIIIKYEDAIAKIPEVIKAIETYDITTIRASTAMYMACEYIKTNFEDVVIFSGEGADEVLGGYLYFHNYPDINEFNKETRRVTQDLQYFDVLRADRCTSAHGLELRVPFLDQDFIKYCFELDPIFRVPTNGIEKYHLRKAFQSFLPEKVLWRRKEALSDGVGAVKKPWFSHIQEWVRENFSKKFSENEFKKSKEIADLCKINHYMSEESLFYYKVFKDMYSFTPIPYYWMPKWQDVSDPSARILKLNL